MSLRYPDNDEELKQIVRAETGYADNEDELSDSDLDVIVERSKGKVELSTDSDQWYTDNGLGFALAAYTCMRAKAAVENVPLASYSFGDEQVSFESADVDQSQQLQQWAEDVRDGLDKSNVDQSVGPTPTNTSGYIGETYTHDRHSDHDHRHH